MTNNGDDIKAMIGKIENGVSCPTAGLLGRLCAGLGVTLSTLMIAIEDADLTFFPIDIQPTWTDPATRLMRRVVAPATRDNDVEIARLLVPPGTVVEYEVAPARAIRQHIIMLSGELDFTIGEQGTHLAPGDCLFAVIDRPTRFEIPGDAPADYFVVQAPA
jgi:mannose-6-phosphate isomerase-like protein (cupin superfamily)